MPVCSLKRMLSMDKENRLKLDALVGHISRLGHELMELQVSYQGRIDAGMYFCVSPTELETMSNKMRDTAHYIDNCLSTCFEELRIAKEQVEAGIRNRKGEN